VVGAGATEAEDEPELPVAVELVPPPLLLGVALVVLLLDPHALTMSAAATSAAM
jgi:hypothetical protein